MIRISSLSVRYEKKGTEILQNVDFSLEKGKIGIFLGPNGAGKSTLLKSCIGLLKPLSGTILIDGVPLEKMKPRERAKKIAYVPQILDFEPGTVYDTVMLGRLPYFLVVPSPHDHEVVSKVLSELGLTELASRNVTSLSGGERQKVAVARALAQESHIVIFDEPTSNLDISSEALIEKEVKELSDKYNKTVLLSVHDLSLAYRLGDQFLFLRGGKVIASGNHDVFREDVCASTFGIPTKKIETEEGIVFITKGK